MTFLDRFVRYELQLPDTVRGIERAVLLRNFSAAVETVVNALPAEERSAREGHDETTDKVGQKVAKVLGLHYRREGNVLSFGDRFGVN